MNGTTGYFYVDCLLNLQVSSAESCSYSCSKHVIAMIATKITMNFSAQGLQKNSILANSEVFTAASAVPIQNLQLKRDKHN